MKKFFRLSWMAFCIVILAVYFTSCLTPFINPKQFSYLSLFAIAFPYIFLVAFLCCISLLFVNKKVAGVLFCLVLVAGAKNIMNSVALRPAKWAMQKDKGSLRIMTWNVEQFINDLQQSDPAAKPRVAMLNAITRFNPDVLCIQEYSETQNGGILHITSKKELDSLGYIYSYISNDSVIETYRPVVFIQGSAIFSRFPLSDSNRVNLINVRRNENLIYADVTFNSRRVRLFTTHLLSFALYTDTTNSNENVYEATYKLKRRVEYKIRETEIIHANEVAHIRSLIDDSPYPVIYCGDINATPASYIYNDLRGNLQDAFLEKGSGLGGTFYKLGKTLRIDVCLPDKKLKVVQCIVPQLYLSDHFPVVTDVTWKN